MGFLTSLKKNALRWFVNRAGRNLKGLWPVIKMFNPSFEADVDKISEIIEDLTFKIDKDARLFISLKLYGEASPITALVDLENAANESAPFIYLEDIEFSRAWLNILLKNYPQQIAKLLGVTISGNKLILPENYASKLRGILPE